MVPNVLSYILACVHWASAPTIYVENCCWRLNTSDSLCVDVCVSVSAGLAVSDTARCSPTRWASGSPCGNAPGDQRSGTPDHGSAPAHTKTHRQRDHIRMVVISCHSCMCTCNPTPRLYLSMWINQQHVTHGGSLHTTEDILTRGRAALSDQEIPTTGEEWLRLLSS